jgi:hypothetical protein
VGGWEKFFKKKEKKNNKKKIGGGWGENKVPQKRKTKIRAEKKG